MRSSPRVFSVLFIFTCADQDAMIAELMGMGFQPEDIEEYQIAMASSSEGFSMQAATEWSAPVCYTCSYVSSGIYTDVQRP